ncbi:hypothetical protein D1224_09185 [Henriciella barbarensis]|uniref:Tryptophan-rich sensory protein n=1 Tax=Henriciella barbarensis TaxID=86342 RepID=A0A399R0S5_9PROT|nr:hypothetical protein [Henriciella barbarensis]RIJ24391.1 hypothetical protein D1224_09185 [Henriciella barbarensis]
MSRKIGIALLIVAIAQFLAPTLPAIGIGEPIGSRGDVAIRPPELPPGLFFSIWGVIFFSYLVFALLSLWKPGYLEHQLAIPLLLAGAGNVIWMVSAQSIANQYADFGLLLPILACSWLAARRLHRMGGFDGTLARLNACALVGLFSGWITAAVSISVAATWREVAGLGPSDHVWISLWLALLSAGLLAWGFASRISASLFYFAALCWGIAGIVVNNWYLTDLHWLSATAALFGLYILWRRFRYGARPAFE